MTRVTDEDLAYVKEHLGLSASEYAKVDAVIAELLALRKVADAAMKWAEQPCEPGPPPRLTDVERELIDALHEASR